MPKAPPLIPSAGIDIASAAFKADPWAAYTRLRAAHPVASTRLPSGEHIVILTRYADVAALLRDARLVNDPGNVPGGGPRIRRPPGFLRPLTRNMLGLDDPDHARLKRLVVAAFTPRRVAALEAQTRAVSTALLDGLAGRESFDLVADYALPLPVRVISDLLGIPAGDRVRFARWSRVLIEAGTARLSLLLSLPSMIAFLRYLRRLIEAKRAAPADDLVSALVHDAAADRLDGAELMAMIAILLSAGHETTTSLIANGMAALLQDRAAWERLAAEPALIDSAVEELLRFAGPVEMSTPRYAREQLEIAGVIIPQGTQVHGVIASANRDAARFEAAARLDLSRTPNRHLTFGEGGHYCVGAALARMEGRVAFSALAERWPAMRLAVPAEALPWRAHPILRGVTRLPVRVR